MTAQLDLFSHRIVSVAERVPMFKGWMQCDCDLVFWLWPVGTGKAPVHCTGTTGAPDLRAFGAWECWRGIKRMTPAVRVSAHT